MKTIIFFIIIFIVVIGIIFINRYYFTKKSIFDEPKIPFPLYLP